MFCEHSSTYFLNVLLKTSFIRIHFQISSAPASPSSSTTSSKPQEAKEKKTINETVNREPETPHDENLPEQTRHIIIPSYAAWFDYNR